MNPTAEVNLALTLLQGVLQLINGIKSQHGLTDDAILAEAEKVTAGNDDAYAALVKALTPAKA